MKMPIKESKETPEMEAKVHSAKFLKAAVSAKLTPAMAKSIRMKANKALGVFLLFVLVALPLSAAPKNFAVTIGASTTQVSTTKVQCNWVVFQNNAANNMAIGDSTTTITTGTLIYSGGGSFYQNTEKSGLYVDLSKWYVAGTQNDVLNIVCDVVPN